MSLFALSQPTVGISGRDDRFPVRRIVCIGKNYAAHTREMGGDPDRTPPTFFTKAADTVVPGGGAIKYPPRTNDLHHEIELVVAIGEAGSDISVDDALNYVFGYAVGIDLTRRDLQAAAKSTGGPWDAAKSFDQSAPISDIVPAGESGHPSSGRIWLSVNDEVRQDGDLDELIWSVPECIAELSAYSALAPGDLVFTGTPAGVGPINTGDKVRGGVDGVGEIEIEITA